MQLSKYFTLEEMIASQTATRKRIDNMPTGDHLNNLMETCREADYVREHLGHPMIVSSGYRSQKLNAAIGGSKTSSHMRGEAIDFTCPGFGSAKEVFEAIKKSGIQYAQLILEFPDSPGAWVHISFGSDRRRESLVFDGHGYGVA